MNPWVDVILVTLILTGFGLLGSSRLATCIRTAALQGVVLGLLPLAESGAGLTLRVIVLSAVVIALKGWTFPWLLSRALRESNTNREVEPYVGYGASLFAGVVFLLAAFWLDARFALPVAASSRLVMPVAFALMMMGLFLIVARRTAVNQVLGYLVLENGIYTFGFAIVRRISLLVELGVLMDVFVAVFVMGIAIYRINREFDHIDADQLNTLKG